MKQTTFLSVLALVLCVCACSPRIDQRGKLPDPERLAQIEPGVHGREDVMRLIGSPSSTSAFGDDTWYYIHKRTSKVSFFEPETLEENIIFIDFDSDGRVKEIHHHNGEGQDITPVKRETPSAAEERSIGEQVLGSFGRFSKMAEQKK